MTICTPRARAPTSRARKKNGALSPQLSKLLLVLINALVILILPCMRIFVLFDLEVSHDFWYRVLIGRRIDEIISWMKYETLRYTQH